MSRLTDAEKEIILSSLRALGWLEELEFIPFYMKKNSDLLDQLVKEVVKVKEALQDKQDGHESSC